MGKDVGGGLLHCICLFFFLDYVDRKWRMIKTLPKTYVSPIVLSQRDDFEHSDGLQDIKNLISLLSSNLKLYYLCNNFSGCGGMLCGNG